MDRRYLPTLFMLIAAAVTSIITYVMDFSIVGKLLSLLLVLVIFGTLGYVLKSTLDSFEKQNYLKRMEEEAAETEAAKEAEKSAVEQDGKVTGQSAI